MKKKWLYTAYFIILLQTCFLVWAEDSGDIYVDGLELDKLLNFGSGILALILFYLTLIAYNRIKNRRLLYVCTAFFLFAAKSFLLALEVFFGDWGWIDIVAGLFDFVILLSFFAGILMK